MCPPSTGQAASTSIGSLGGTATLNVTPSTKGVPLPGPATVNLPFQNNLDVVSSQLSIYASADGTTYLRIQDSYVNAGFLQSSLPKFGFVFAGYPQTAADLVACGASGGAP